MKMKIRTTIGVFLVCISLTSCAFAQFEEKANEIYIQLASELEQLKSKYSAQHPKVHATEQKLAVLKDALNQERQKKREQVDQKIMMEKLQALSVEHEELRKRLGPQHPQMKSIQNQINIISEFLDRSAQTNESNERTNRHTKIAKLTAQLAELIGASDPRNESEELLANGLTQLKQGLALLDERSELTDEVIELRRLESALSKANQNKLDDVRKQLMSEATAKYKQLILERESQLKTMEQQIRNAELAAREMQERHALLAVAADRALEKAEQAKVEAKIQQEKSHLQKATLEERMAQMENQHAEIRDMLQKLLDSSKSKSKNDKK